MGKSCIWRVQIRGFPGSHSICCYLCSRAVKRGEGLSAPCLPVSFQLLCLSIGLLAYLLVVCTSPPLLSLYPCLRCSCPGSRERGFTDTRTICMGEESWWWVRGQEDISTTSILFPLSSTCDDRQSLGWVGGLVSLDDRLANEASILSGLQKVI